MLGLTTGDIGAMADSRVCRDWRSVAVIVLSMMLTKLPCFADPEILHREVSLFIEVKLFSYLKMNELNILFLNLNQNDFFFLYERVFFRFSENSERIRK